MNRAITFRFILRSRDGVTFLPVLDHCMTREWNITAGQVRAGSALDRTRTGSQTDGQTDCRRPAGPADRRPGANTRTGRKGHETRALTSSFHRRLLPAKGTLPSANHPAPVPGKNAYAVTRRGGLGLFGLVAAEALHVVGQH